MVHSAEHLVFVGRGLAQGLGRDVNEDRLRGAG